MYAHSIKVNEKHVSKHNFFKKALNGNYNLK